MTLARFVLTAMVLVIALSLLAVLKWEFGQRRSCVESCRRGSWAPGADQCERLCTGGRP